MRQDGTLVFWFVLIVGMLILPEAVREELTMMVMMIAAGLGLTAYFNVLKK